MHDTFLRCRSRLDTLEDPRSYLRAAVVNECRSVHRRLRRSPPRRRRPRAPTAGRARRAPGRARPAAVRATRRDRPAVLRRHPRRRHRRGPRLPARHRPQPPAARHREPQRGTGMNDIDIETRLREQLPRLADLAVVDERADPPLADGPVRRTGAPAAVEDRALAAARRGVVAVASPAPSVVDRRHCSPGRRPPRRRPASRPDRRSQTLTIVAQQLPLRRASEYDVPAGHHATSTSSATRARTPCGSTNRSSRMCTCRARGNTARRSIRSKDSRTASSARTSAAVDHRGRSRPTSIYCVGCPATRQASMESRIVVDDHDHDHAPRSSRRAPGAPIRPGGRETPMQLDGKVAIVTGGGSGLGRASATALAAAGAQVVVGDVDDDGAAATVAAIAEAGGDGDRAAHRRRRCRPVRRARRRRGRAVRPARRAPQQRRRRARRPRRLRARRRPRAVGPRHRRQPERHLLLLPPRDPRDGEAGRRLDHQHRVVDGAPPPRRDGRLRREQGRRGAPHEVAGTERGPARHPGRTRSAPGTSTRR